MSVWHDIIMAMRGLSHEVFEKWTDSFALNQIESNTYAARKHLEKGQQHLQQIIRTRHKLQQASKDLQHTIQQLNKRLIVIQKTQPDQAHAIQVKTTQLQQSLVQQQHLEQAYQQKIRELKVSIYQTEQNIKTMRREVLALRATASIQKARTLSNSHHRFSSRESLQRIRQRQQQQRDLFNAHDQTYHPHKQTHITHHDSHVEYTEILFDDLDYRESLRDKVEKTHTQAMHEAMTRILDDNIND